jgi:hypothetical protein
MKLRRHDKDAEYSGPRDLLPYVPSAEDDESSPEYAPSGKSPVFDDAQDQTVNDASPPYAPSGKSPVLEASPPYAPSGKSPVFDGSPEYAPSGKSPVFDGSPEYAPSGNSPVFDGSPEYAPSGNSPVFDASPPYAPESFTSGSQYSIGQNVKKRGTNELVVIKDVGPEFITVMDTKGTIEVLDPNMIETVNPFQKPMIRPQEEQPSVSAPPVNVVVITGDKSGNVTGEPAESFLKEQAQGSLQSSEQSSEQNPTQSQEPKQTSFMKPLINFMTGSKTEESTNEPNKDGTFVVKKV